MKKKKGMRLIKTDLLKILMQTMGKAAGDFRKGIITIKELERRNTFDGKAMRLVNREIKLSEKALALNDPTKRAGLFKEAEEARSQLEDMLKTEGLL